MKVVIAGGGTGGHLYPGIALARTFMQFDPASEILFIGTAAGMEAKLLPEAGFAFAAIPASGWVGKSARGRLRALMTMPSGLWESMQILRRFLPHIVIGVGGYAAGPVMLAACLLRHKLLLLEPNAVPGLVNRWMAPRAHKVMIAFEATRAYLKGQNLVCCGTPVRPEIVAVRSNATSSRANRPWALLVLGGSQGSHAINRAMMEAAPILSSMPVTILHQTGQTDATAVRAAYDRHGVKAQVSAYLHDMAGAYGACDLVVSRAGAGTLAEISAAGLPAILIPYPFAQGHQAKNAEALVSAGAAEMILERDLNGPMLARRISDLLDAPKRRMAMAAAAARLGHPHSAEEMVRIAYQVAGIPTYPPLPVGEGRGEGIL
jgi:UDP-N-acetylglucosamine--N-acetylmuramyl-(pentapeptide) pyrophosphoryl-undecaprenol N-acetylglucosamine transferase